MIRQVIGHFLIEIKSVFVRGTRMFTIPYFKSIMAECGKNVYIGHNVNMIYAHIHIGSNVYVGNGCNFILARSNLYIGNNVMFGPNVTIRGGDHRIDVLGEYMSNVTEKLQKNDKDVIIESDVWIGCNVTILKGVTVGKGSVIGAGSVLTKDVPPYTIHVGSPGMKEYKRFSEEEIQIHEKMLQQKYQV